MLTFNLNRIMAARGHHQAFSFLVQSGFSENTATRLSKGRITSFRLRYVERLCEVLRCTPNDLLEWQPGETTDVEKHPLASLRRKDTVIQLTQLLNSVPYDRLDEIEELLRKEIEKKP